MKKIVSILFATLMCAGVFAQYMVEIQPTKKVLHVDQLGVPDNTDVKEVLQAMPELLDRSSTSDYFANFSIQVDGKDVGSSRDVVLNQTKVAEVDVIEVSTSPMVSEQKNGEGGVINIKLKPISEEGVSGQVMVDVNTEVDVQPSVLLNYKKDKFTLRSSIMMEYYEPASYLESSCQDRHFAMNRLDTTYRRFLQETAKILLKWTPTTQDEVEVYAWETFGYGRDITHAKEVILNNYEEDYNPAIWHETRLGGGAHESKHELKTDVNVSYKHKYERGGEFKVEANYNYSPVRDDEDVHWRSIAEWDMLGADTSYTRKVTTHNHQVMGEISTKHLLLAQTSEHKLDVKVGINANYSMGETVDVLSKKAYSANYIDTTDNQIKTLTVSPFMEWNYSYHGWTIQLGGRYQFYRKEENTRTLDWYTRNGHTWSGNLSVMWQVKPHHHLRAVMARNSVWKSVGEDNMGHQVPKVLPYYNAELNYIFDWNNTVDYTMMNVGLKYIYVKPLSGGDVGILAANAQLIYKHGIFSMAFAGNVYVKREKSNVPDKKDQWCFYYNLSLTPVFSLRKNWTLSAQILYNSDMTLRDAIYGDCFYTQLRVSKNIGKWNVHLQFSDILDYTTYNTVCDPSYHNGRPIRIEQDMYPRSVLVGFAYKF